LDAAAKKDNNEETGENNERKEDERGKVSVDSVASKNGRDAYTLALKNVERSSTSAQRRLFVFQFVVGS
jgi:hypothetical protein